MRIMVCMSVWSLLYAYIVCYCCSVDVYSRMYAMWCGSIRRVHRYHSYIVSMLVSPVYGQENVFSRVKHSRCHTTKRHIARTKLNYAHTNDLMWVCRQRRWRWRRESIENIYFLRHVFSAIRTIAVIPRPHTMNCMCTLLFVKHRQQPEWIFVEIFRSFLLLFFFSCVRSFFLFSMLILVVSEKSKRERSIVYGKWKSTQSILPQSTTTPACIRVYVVGACVLVLGYQQTFSNCEENFVLYQYM